MTEGANKERVNGVEATVENMVEAKCATRSVAWYDIAVILLFFMLSQALGGFVTAFLGVRLPGEAYTTSFDADVLEEAASMQARFVAITYAISMVICFALLWIYRLLRGWKGVLSLRTTGWLASFRLLCGYLLMWCVSIAVEPLAELLPGDQSSLGGGCWVLVSAVMLAPLYEEGIFRGYTAGSRRRL